MPMYEYHCPDCDNVFTVYMTMEEHEDSNSPICPTCGGKHVKQAYTDFSILTSKKS